MKNKIKCLIILCIFLSASSYAQLGTTTSTIVSDNHSNGNFSSGSGGGSGMGNWSISESNGSKYIGGTGLGTDGFGRSDSRAKLREFFEVDAKSIVMTAAFALHKEGQLNKKELQKIYKEIKVNKNKISPWNT